MTDLPLAKHLSPKRPAPRRMVRRPDTLTGVTGVKGILGKAVADLGCRIVGGEWLPGEAIPREADLCEDMGVSRSVVREAFRILGAKGLIRSRTSDGTRVLPRAQWRLLDADVMDWRIRAGDSTRLLEDLLTLRLTVEPGAVRLATELADDAARDLVRKAWQAKVEVMRDPPTDPLRRRDAFTDADLPFHRAFLQVTGSELLEQLFTVIEAALRLLLDLQMQARGYDTGTVGMHESHALHEKVYEAFMARDPQRAEEAMHKLIQCAILDARDGLARVREQTAL
jgi:GntR family transcriptional regulator, galactonate operon transcriptional repressor